MKKIGLLVLALLLALGSLGVGYAADKPIDDDDPEEFHGPGPIDDISEAVPFSHPLANRLNPDSPRYDPRLRYGGEWTRFGPPGKRLAHSPVEEAQAPEFERQDCWGTEIYSWIGADAVFARQRFWDFGFEVFPGQFLYAPTLQCPGYGPLESVTVYRCDMLRKYWGVWDHLTGEFEYIIDFNDSEWDDYARGRYYETEILYDDGYWYVLLYNFADEQWEYIYSRTGFSDDHRGWDIWEGWDMDDPLWPDLHVIRSKNLQVRIDSTWHGVTQQFGKELKELQPGFPYRCVWHEEYFDWQVQ